MGPGPFPWQFVDMGPMATLGAIMSDPTDIDETYALKFAGCLRQKTAFAM